MFSVRPPSPPPAPPLSLPVPLFPSSQWRRRTAKQPPDSASCSSGAAGYSLASASSLRWSPPCPVSFSFSSRCSLSLLRLRSAEMSSSSAGTARYFSLFEFSQLRFSSFLTPLFWFSRLWRVFLVFCVFSWAVDWRLNRVPIGTLYFVFRLVFDLVASFGSCFGFVYWFDFCFLDWLGYWREFR